MSWLESQTTRTETQLTRHGRSNAWVGNANDLSVSAIKSAGNANDLTASANEWVGIANDTTWLFKPLGRKRKSMVRLRRQVGR